MIQSINFGSNLSRRDSHRKLFFTFNVIVFLFIFNRYTELENTLDGANLQVEALEKLKKDSSSQKQENFASENIAFKKIIEQLNMPWSDFFTNLEKSTSNNIAMLSINPDPSKETMVIEGVAKNSESLISFVNKINDSHLFEQAYIKSQKMEDENPEPIEATDKKKSSMPLRFTISASWSHK